MKNLLMILLGFLCTGQVVFANTRNLAIDESQNGIVVFQGKKKVNSFGLKLSYAFAKGDQVVVKFSTEKGKNLKNVRITDIHGEKVLWNLNNSANGNSDVKINAEGVYAIEFKAKGMGGRDVTIDIVRIPGSVKEYNTAWMKYNTYTPKEVTYSVDSMIGYKAPVVIKKDIKIFNKYYYQNVELYSYDKQILGQAGMHNSQAVGYPMAIRPDQVPQGAKFKCYTYSLSSVLGGAKHWAIADIAVSVGALFLSPVGAFAAHGAMGLIGPEPGNEPVQYFMSNRQSDINVVKEIYSPYNEGRKATNIIKDGIGEAVGVFSGGAKDVVKGTKVKSYSESDLSYNQKGKVTNLFVSTARPPIAKYFIMANPELSQAKNTKMNGSAIFYAPTYRTVKADELYYEVQTVPLQKSKTDMIKTEVFGTIKN